MLWRQFEQTYDSLTRFAFLLLHFNRSVPFHGHIAASTVIIWMNAALLKTTCSDALFD
jgi:hypothetical protein